MSQEWEKFHREAMEYLDKKIDESFVNWLTSPDPFKAMSQATNESREWWEPECERVWAGNIDGVKKWTRAVVEEAERMGERKAWEEAKEVIKDLLPKPSPVGMGECAFCGAWLDECHCNPGSIDAEALSEIFNAKIKGLSEYEKRI